MHRVSVLLLVCGLSSSAFAIVPFHEPFASNASNWRQSDGLTDLSWTASGGLDGSSFASASFNFINQPANATPIIFRGATTYNTSGNALFGDWRTDPVTEVLVDLRHDASVPLTFFARFSPGAAGAVALSAVTLPAGSWQQVRFGIVPAVPPLIFEGPGVTYDTVFSNVTRVQFGVLVPQDLAGVDQNFRFDVDNIRVVPSPGAALFVGLAMLGVRRKR